MLSPEKFCDDVKSALLQNLQAALDAQTQQWAAADAAAGREIPLVAPAEDDYYIGGATVIVKYPTIEIAVSDASFTGFSIENTDGDFAPRLHIRGSFQEARDSEWLYRMGCRWFGAVVDVVAAPGAFGEVDIDGSRGGITGAWRFNPQTGESDDVQTFVLATFNLLGPLSPFGL